MNAGNTTLYAKNLPTGCVRVGRVRRRRRRSVRLLQYHQDNSSDSTVPYNGPAPPGGPDAAAGKFGKGQTIPSITDGTSNTVMAAEIIQGRTNDLRGLTWWGGSAGFTTFNAPNSGVDFLNGGICPAIDYPNLPRCTTTGTTSGTRMISARGYHTGGINASMCDGSVRFVQNSIDINAWRAAGTARGGEVLQLN